MSTWSAERIPTLLNSPRSRLTGQTAIQKQLGQKQSAGSVSVTVHDGGISVQRDNTKVNPWSRSTSAWLMFGIAAPVSVTAILSTRCMKIPVIISSLMPIETETYGSVHLLLVRPITGRQHAPIFHACRSVAQTVNFREER